MKSFSELSKKIIYIVLSLALIIIITGAFFLENAHNFREISFAKKTVETGFNLVPLSILSAAITEYIRNKTVS